ncbi:MAG TPA: DUF692 domain-containing protein, partial [Rhodanobacteraceae bacterium]|nr:DUF692 domain-containing protein [Rhodanobacteraceae bacterium]
RITGAPCPGVDWFEVITENVLVAGGNPRRVLRAVRAEHPVVLHGVSLSIGGSDPLDMVYLDALKALARRCRAHWISDHLCWSGLDGRNLHDLLPLPFTPTVARHVAARVGEVQDFLGRRIALENVSSYVTCQDDVLSEAAFLADVCQRADCDILLDVNNVYVNAHNHGFDPDTYLAALPAARIRQIHLAGHSRQGALLIDTHDAPVCDAVWQLYAKAVARFGPIPTMIERDDNIPALEALLAELARARAIAARELQAA